MNTKRWTLVVVNIATAMLMLDIAVVNTALPRIGEDLETGLTGLQWVVDSYTLTLATTVLTAGALADRLGRRRLFAIGLGIFTVSSLVAAMAGSIEMLNTARAVQGIGGAILFATSLALLAQAYPGKKERTGALAIYGATIGASFAVGPLVGGALTSGLDWQWVFLINVPVGIAALAITFTRVDESRDPRPRRIDWPGQITLTAGLALLVLGLLRGNEDGWTSTLILAELVGRGDLPERVRPGRVARARADAAARHVPQAVVHRRAGRGVRDLRIAVRGLHLRDALPAGRARAVGRRGRARAAARHVRELRGRRHDRADPRARRPPGRARDRRPGVRRRSAWR